MILSNNGAKRFVVMASGSGSTFEALVEASQKGQLSANILCLIVSRADAGAVERAKRLGVPVQVIDPRAYSSREHWDQALTSRIQELKPDWVVLAGFTQLIGPKLLSSYSGRILNTHPSLLPKYGGKGMYGRRVHEAVIGAGEKETGVTVHVVTADYDEGPILGQTKVPVHPEDTPDTLAERLKSIERGFYVEVLNQLR